MDDYGFIKLYRCLLDKAIWKTSSPEHKVILITLLMMANHTETEWEWQGEKYKVKPGQFITSLENIRRKAGKGISIQNIRSALKKFQNLYMFLTDEPTKTGRLITIVNWELYQTTEKKLTMLATEEPTKNQQRGNKEVTPNKNDKNDKNDKNKNIYNNPPYSPPLKKKGGIPAVENYTANHELKKAIYDFIDMRKQIKKPMTPRAIELLFKDLDRLSSTDQEKILILEQSILNSWQGVFPLKEQPPQTNEKRTKPNPVGRPEDDPIIRMGLEMKRKREMMQKNDSNGTNPV